MFKVFVLQQPFALVTLIEMRFIACRLTREPVLLLGHEMRWVAAKN
jgi:hypothetical protein